MVRYNHFLENWKNYLILVLVILFIANIFSNSNMGFSSMGNFVGNTESLGISKSMVASDSFAPNEVNRKVIKNGNIRIESSDYDKSNAQIKNSLNSYNAIILSETEVKDSEDYKTLNFNIKVESDNLNLILTEIKTYGEILSINIYSNDVTGIYTDYSSRIDRYNGQIIKYNLMLDKNDIEIKDEIQIQNRIDQLEDKIFNLENNKESIDENSKYSTLYISLKEKHSIFSQANFLGLGDGFKLFLTSINSAIEFILNILGFIIPFGIIYGIYRFFKNYF